MSWAVTQIASMQVFATKEEAELAAEISFLMAPIRKVDDRPTHVLCWTDRDPPIEDAYNFGYGAGYSAPYPPVRHIVSGAGLLPTKEYTVLTKAELKFFPTCVQDPLWFRRNGSWERTKLADSVELIEDDDGEYYQTVNTTNVTSVTMTKNSVPLGKLLIDAHFITGVKLSSWESRDKKNQDNLNRIGAKFLEMVEPVKAPEQEPDFDALDTITEAEGSWGFNSMGERYRFKTRGEAITLQKYFASGRIFDEAKRVKVKHYPEVWTDQLIWTDKGVDYGSRDGLLPPEDNDNWDVSLIEGDVTDRLYSKDPETEASAILKEGFDLESDLDPVEAARKAVEAHEQLASILEEADERLVSAFGIGDGHRDSIDSIDLAKTVEEAIATYQAVGAKNASISATRPDRSAEEAIAYAAQLETLFEPIRKALGAKEGETILAAAERLGKEKGVQSESPMGFLAGLIGMSALGGVALGAKAKPTRVALPAKTVQGLAEDDVQEKEELNAISNGH